MNESRYDWLRDRWVLFAPNRYDRPDEYRTNGYRPRTARHVSPIDPDASDNCPFCLGNEHETPPATLLLPASGDSQQIPWSVRVVPNRFPALTHGEFIPLHRDASLNAFVDGMEGINRGDWVDGPKVGERHRYPHRHFLFQKRASRGVHEVFIESPDHVSSLTSLSLDHAALVFQAYQRRLAHWRSFRDLRYAVIFKNYGSDAGASLSHAHSQLICTDFIPNDIAKIHDRMQAYWNEHQCCLLCASIEHELQVAQRVIAQTEEFVAFCPFASQLPGWVTIVPKRHGSEFNSCSDGELRDLALLTQSVLRAIEIEFPSVSYNYVLQTAPFVSSGPPDSPHYHWSLEIIPRLCKVAGFEWGSNCYINTLLPETAARQFGSHFRTHATCNPSPRTVPEPTAAPLAMKRS